MNILENIFSVPAHSMSRTDSLIWMKLLSARNSTLYVMKYV